MDKQKNTLDTMTGGIILIGIGLIFLLELDFFPTILFVLGLAIMPSAIAREGTCSGLQGSLWLIGIGTLFALDIFWPGILILIGLSVILGAFAKPEIGEKRKRKNSEL